MRGSGFRVRGSVQRFVVRFTVPSSKVLAVTPTLNLERGTEPGTSEPNFEPGTRHPEPKRSASRHFSIPTFVAFSADRIASRLRPWTADRAKRRRKPLSERVRARLTEIM